MRARIKYIVDSYEHDHRDELDDYDGNPIEIDHDKIKKFSDFINDDNNWRND